MKWWQNPNGNAATICCNKHICEANNKLWWVNHTSYWMCYLDNVGIHTEYIFLRPFITRKIKAHQKVQNLSVPVLNSHRIKLICILIQLALMKLVQELIFFNSLTFFFFWFYFMWKIEKYDAVLIFWRTSTLSEFRFSKITSNNTHSVPHIEKTFQRYRMEQLF